MTNETSENVHVITSAPPEEETPSKRKLDYRKIGTRVGIGIAAVLGAAAVCKVASSSSKKDNSPEELATTVTLEDPAA